VRAIRYIPLALLSVAVSAVVAHSDQGWQDNQDAAGLYLWDLPAPATLPAGIQPTAPLLYGGHAAASLVSNPTGSTGVAIDVTLGNGLGFNFPAPGVNQLENTSPLFALSAVTPLNFDSATNALTAPGVVYTGGVPPFDLGTLSTSILACVRSGASCTPDGVTVSGGLNFNTATSALTDAAFSCGSNQWVSSTSTSGPTCTQPSIGNLQSIGAHTIVANGTALAAAPAQTSIGTTMAFDGTGQLQCVGLRDGGGVNHVTTGTWPISSVIETDVSGNIAAEAQLACGQSEGPWTGDARKSAGSCAVTNGAITETSGPTSLTIGAIPNSAPDSTTLIRPAGSPTVVGVATSTVVSASVTKLSFSLQLQLGSSIPNTWLLQGGAGLFSNGALIEYPNDFAAGHITINWYLRSNVVTAGTLTAFASRNGTAVTGSGISVSPTTTATVHVGTPLATGSTSASDTYGIGFSTSGTYAAASPTSVFLTFEVILTP
jgi:hypothetical protein